MLYTFGLVKHANIRYRDSFIRLSRCELQAMLHALSIDCEMKQEALGGADFISFECRSLSPGEISFLSRHSSAAFLAEKAGGGLLRPLSFERRNYLGEDLPEVLKYKGKTSPSFTRLMVNMALSLSPFCFSASPVTLFDPLCGKGTSCFCALQSGMNAVGLDTDKKAVREASDYFSRYLKFHMLKHAVQQRSETCGSRSLPVTEFVFADTKEHYQAGDTRFLALALGDTADCGALFRRKAAHLVVADLPYGVQHAPQSGAKAEPFNVFLRRSLASWKKSLMPGGVAAVSFNTLVTPYAKVAGLAEEAGFAVCSHEPYTRLRHEVEQAVVRDAVFLMNEP